MNGWWIIQFGGLLFQCGFPSGDDPSHRPWTNLLQVPELPASPEEGGSLAWEADVSGNTVFFFPNFQLFCSWKQNLWNNSWVCICGIKCISVIVFMNKSFAHQHCPVPPSTRISVSRIMSELWLILIWLQKLWQYCEAFRACKVTVHFYVPCLAKVRFSASYIYI